MSEKIAVAIYQYIGQHDTQLTFDEGDRIIVLEENKSGWWYGRLEKNHNGGYFPSTYIKPIDEIENATTESENLKATDFKVKDESKDEQKLNNEANESGMEIESFKWNIDGFVLKAIKAANFKSAFYSPEFDLYGSRYKLILHPNGWVGPTINTGKGSIVIRLMAIGKMKKMDFIALGSIKEIGQTFGSDGDLWELPKSTSMILSCKAQMRKTTNLKVSNEIKEEHKMNDEVKESEIDQLVAQIKIMTSEIKDIKRRLNLLESKTNDNINPKQQMLKKWLEETVDLGMYYNVFVENGIVDVNTAKLLTMDTLKAIGVDKIGHQMILLNLAN